MTSIPPSPASESNEAKQPTIKPDGGYDASGLNRYRRILILTDGFSTPFLAKTAISLIRYRGGDVVGVLESSAAGQTVEHLFGIGSPIPVVASLGDVDADALYIGIAPPGVKLPEAWFQVIR